MCLKNRLPNLNESDYLAAYRDLERFSINNINVKIMGTFGEVNEPPISDLDIFFCLGDANFVEDKNKIVSYINKHDILSYVIDHDPFILPESLLPYLKYLHTVYNFKASHNTINYKIQSISDDYMQLLNLLWTFTFVVRSPKKTPKVKTLRKQLLLLKNFHHSASNLMLLLKESHINYLEKSKILREKYISGNINNLDIEVEQEIHNTRNDILRMMNKIPHGFFLKNTFNEPLIFRFRKIRVSRALCVKRGETVHSISNKNFNCLTLNNELYKLFYSLYFHFSNDPLIKEYIKKSDEAALISNKLGIVSPFYIRPFRIKVGKKNYSKMLLINIMDALKLI